MRRHRLQKQSGQLHRRLLRPHRHPLGPSPRALAAGRDCRLRVACTVGRCRTARVITVEPGKPLVGPSLIPRTLFFLRPVRAIDEVGTVLSRYRSLRGGNRPLVSKDRILRVDTGTNPYTLVDIVTGHLTIIACALECTLAILGRNRAVVREFRGEHEKGFASRNGLCAGPRGTRRSRSR